jgi:hypothetical protein
MYLGMQTQNAPPSLSEALSAKSSSPFNRRRDHIPTLLLLTMHATAARYSSGSDTPPTDCSAMWTAGDDYLDRAKVILDGSYSSSRPSTCQVLLLMGYGEIGIGAMAQAWTYIQPLSRASRQVPRNLLIYDRTRPGCIANRWTYHWRYCLTYQPSRIRSE